MTKSIVSLLLCFLAVSAYSQTVPNGNFESPPFDWTYMNAPGISLGGSRVIKRTEAVSDTVFPFEGNGCAAIYTFQDSIAGGRLGQKFALTERPESYQFMYNYFKNGAGDVGRATIIFTKYNSSNNSIDTILEESILFTEESSPDWELASIDLRNKYRTTDNPDTAIIFFESSISDSSYQNTTLTIDNIEFATISVGIEQISLGLENMLILPNPAQYSCSISFETANTTAFKYAIYGVDGKLMYETTEPQPISARHEVSIDLSAFDSGLYWIVISSDHSSQTEKLIISR